MFKVVSDFDAFLIKGPFKWIISENIVSVNNAVKGDLAGWHLKDLGFMGAAKASGKSESPCQSIFFGPLLGLSPKNGA